ncbi:MAG: aminotransferase class V-fold PLP-dependent enzyme [Clostridium sp.]|uniref:aminotransferase class V-fold PLP-dependent enzyme n=1 Tax=Clostridium sp. TaxID=1506 RepID=UPI00302462FB
MSNFTNNPYRDLIYGVDNKIPLWDKSKCIGINFDNAATTPPFKSVIDEIVKFSPYYSSIHRGDGYKSQLSTEIYENSRIVVKSFLGDCNNLMDVIYVKNCTEGINKLAGILATKKKGSIVLSTSMEHHSNDLPWRNNFNVKYVNIDSRGCLDMDDLKSKLEMYGDNISLVAITGASNVTGIKNPIYSIANLVHSFGAKILVDCAQLIPHSKFTIGANLLLGPIDFVTFSGHKMYAPFGCGVLLGPKDFFNEYAPDHSGGGTISFVSHEKVIWADSPDKDEAGSPNVIGSLALSASISELSRIGMENLDQYEKHLTMYATKNLLSMDYVTLYGNYNNFEDKVSIIPFNIEGIHHTLVSKILSYEFGIAVRSGCFCAHPYLQKLMKLPDYMIEELTLSEKSNRPGMVRISFGLYNTMDEVTVFLYAMNKITKNRDFYVNKYKNISESLL